MKTKNWYKGLTATAITLAMAGAALTVPAMAIDYDLNYGNVFVEGTESWQQDTAGNQFHYVVSNTTEGSYEFVSGKYQHTTDDATVHITQGTIGQEQIINEEDTNDTVDEGAVLEEVKGNAQTGVAVDSTVTISNGTTGDDTDTGTAADGTTGTTSGGGTEENTESVDAVDVTISDVNVDIDAKKDFITVEDGTTANITIEHSTVQTEGSVVDIGSGSDVTLNLNGETTVDENGTEVDGSNEFTSFNGITVDGADLTINHDGINNFTGTDETVSENNRFEWTGIYLTNGADVDIIGADADAELTISNYENNIAVNSQEETNLDISIGTVNLTDASGDKSGFSGNGIFITHANGDFNLSVSGTQTGVDENGEKVFDTHFNANDNDNGAGIYYAVQAGAVNNSITVTNTDFSVSDNGWVGMYLETSSGKNTYTFDNSRVHINSNGSNGITGQGNTNLVIKNESVVHVDNNKGIGTNNTNAWVEGNSYFSVSNNNSHGFTNGSFDIFNSVADFNNNTNRGLNISKASSGLTSSQVIDSIVTANNNGQSGIYYQVGAQITDSAITALDNGKNDGSTSHRAGILMYKDSVITDSTLMVDGADVGIVLYDQTGYSGVMKVVGSSVLAVNGNVWDFYDDWNSNGYTGRDFITSGSLQADLDAMYGYYILNDPSLEGKTGLELFLAIAAKYNKGEGINAIVTGAPAGSVVAGSANDTQYTGPVNENGTLLFRFDLNGEIDKGAAMKNNGDGTYTFTYTDPNTGKVVEYTFRYNTDGEDLTGTGNNAYVWTPVTIINYDPLNNDLSGSQIGTAHDNGNNTATDVTIFGTTINLAEKNMPSYDAKVDTDVTTTTDANGATVTTTTTTTSTFGWWVHVDENGHLQTVTPPAKDASQEEWEKFYSLLNYQVTEETNLLDLCGGDRALAESITVYGMWTTETEQTVVTTPAEPEIPEPPYIPDYPELPDYDPPEVDIDDPDVPLVEEPEEPEEPEQPTEEIDDEETPLTPSIPDEVVDEIIAEIEDEVTPLTSVPKTGAEMPAATAALPAGVLALAVAALVRRTKRKN